MSLDIRPVYSALLGDIATSVKPGANPRVDALVERSADVLATAHRLGVTDLGTTRKPLFLHMTADPAASSTPIFWGDDTMLIGMTPIDGYSREFLRSRTGAALPDGANWLDIDLGGVVPHEIGHGVIDELVPQVMQPIPPTGAWRTHRFDQSVVTEAKSDVFAAIHQRQWDMTLGGATVRDAATGVDHVGSGYATVDTLNEARQAARVHGVDDMRLEGSGIAVTLDESRPHRLAGLLTPAYATIERHHGWDATEAVFTGALTRMRESGDRVNVPMAAKETARAAIAELGRADDAAVAVRRMLMQNGSMG